MPVPPPHDFGLVSRTRGPRRRSPHASTSALVRIGILELGRIGSTAVWWNVERVRVRPKRERHRHKSHFAQKTRPPKSGDVPASPLSIQVRPHVGRRAEPPSARAHAPDPHAPPAQASDVGPTRPARPPSPTRTHSHLAPPPPSVAPCGNAVHPWVLQNDSDIIAPHVERDATGRRLPWRTRTGSRGS